MAKTLIVLSVDPEFRDLCPPLDEEEKRLLREAIIEEKGARDPIVYWETDGNPILDGHHRHEICGETGLPYPTKGLTFPDRETAIRWIWRHQLGKRNLTDANKHILRGRYYNSLKGVRGGCHGAKSKNDTLLNQAAEIADAEHVSESSVKRDGRLAEAEAAIRKISPVVANKVVSGEIPASTATALADAPKAAVKKLEKLDGQALKKAARKTATPKATTAKPPKNGQVTWADKDFKDVYEYLGKGLPKLGQLNRKHPTKFYCQAEAALKAAMRAVDEWKVATKP